MAGNRNLIWMSISRTLINWSTESKEGLNNQPLEGRGCFWIWPPYVGAVSLSQSQDVVFASLSGPLWPQTFASKWQEIWHPECPWLTWLSLHHRGVPVQKPWGRGSVHPGMDQVSSPGLIKQTMERKRTVSELAEWRQRLRGQQRVGWTVLDAAACTQYWSVDFLLTVLRAANEFFLLSDARM